LRSFARGRINAAKYGTNACDQWSVDELLTLAQGVAAFSTERIQQAPTSFVRA
jgi:hypothetical protein